MGVSPPGYPAVAQWLNQRVMMLMMSAQKENVTANHANGTAKGPLPFFFYAGDRQEPPHIHVERDDKIAKFWLDPVRLQRSGGVT